MKARKRKVPSAAELSRRTYRKVLKLERDIGANHTALCLHLLNIEARSAKQEEQIERTIAIHKLMLKRVERALILGEANRFMATPLNGSTRAQS
jgi:hypothetical protein